MSDWMSLFIFIAIVVGVAASGAVFMPGAWYQTLNKPSWTPPNWLFAPAWSALYLMIAIAGWLIWTRAGFSAALIIWALNLIFNAAWSWLMFGRRQIRTALIDALGMLVTIIAFMALAWPINPLAMWLFAPYLAWVMFATALNASLLRRNPFFAK